MINSNIKLLIIIGIVSLNTQKILGKTYSTDLFPTTASIDNNETDNFFTAFSSINTGPDTASDDTCSSIDTVTPQTIYFTKTVGNVDTTNPEVGDLLYSDSAGAMLLNTGYLGWNDSGSNKN